jgi:SOS-response transcriptional repressor LexA
MSLTPRQAQAFEAIKAFNAAHGRTPTFRELANALGLNSLSSIRRLLDGLQERGYITRMLRRAHSITIADGTGLGPPWLPPALRANLDAYCRLAGEDPAGVIEDAVKLHLDAIGVLYAAGGGS